MRDATHVQRDQTNLALSGVMRNPIIIQQGVGGLTDGKLDVDATLTWLVCSKLPGYHANHRRSMAGTKTIRHQCLSLIENHAFMGKVSEGKILTITNQPIIVEYMLTHCVERTLARRS